MTNQRRNRVIATSRNKVSRKETAGAVSLHKNKRSSLSNYLQQHQLALRSAWQRMLKSRTATIMTVVVIGIALALPASLKVLMSNAQQFNRGLDQQAQITVFLKAAVHGERAKRLVDQLNTRKDINSVEHVPADKAFEEFKQLSGFGQALEGLKRNPLPGLLIVYPKKLDDPGGLDKLVEALRQMPESDAVQLDREWLQRLFAILDLMRQGTLLITVFLIIAVIMVVGNTIRLMSQSYQDEIEVNKLVGATDGFVRRPFLYTGALYGLVGGIIAWLVITTSILWLSPALSHISSLYHDAFSIRGLNLADSITLILTGLVLGLGGSWIAVGRFLRETTP